MDLFEGIEPVRYSNVPGRAIIDAGSKCLGSEAAPVPGSARSPAPGLTSEIRL
jgi:D-serine deaminase-like pyridoxal phosphate-dependent protein